MENHPFPTRNIYEGACSVALIANGAIQDYNFIVSLLRSYDRCIAVDGGLIHCREMNILPDLIIGDLDSIPLDLLQFYPHVPQEIFPSDKDETDMELAVRAISTSAVRKIGLFGAMEKRTDHALANLHLMRCHPEKIVIETEKETIMSIAGRSQFDCYPGQEISLIPIGSSPTGVTTSGLKWELKDAQLNKNFISLSNVCLNSHFEISIVSGDLICCILR